MRNFYATFLGLGFVLVLTTSFSKLPTHISEMVTTGEQSMVFKTDGLYYAEFYDYIYRGHFEHIKLKRGDTEFLMIFEQYLRAYGSQCDQFLPANKVRIMDEACATEEVTTNGYGMETGRVCIEWTWIPSGLYACPDL